MNITTELQNHWLWQDKPFAKGQAWIDLLLLADSESIFFRGTVYRLPKGHVVTSENELAKRWGWSRSKVRNLIQMLCAESMLTLKGENNHTLITIKDAFKQTAPKTIAQPNKGPLIRQDNPSVNKNNTEIKKQVDNLLEKQNTNTTRNNSKASTETTYRQLTIMDAIKGKK